MMASTGTATVDSRGERARRALLVVVSAFVLLGAVGLLLALPSVLV